jgi:hypothetical protein
METIDRAGYDKLGEVIREWFEEEGIETDSSQDVELLNRILDCLGIKAEW